MNQTPRQKIGEMGEKLACRHLQQEGYQILEQNYRQKWGEIDIIAKYKNIFTFIEVKTLVYSFFPTTKNPFLTPEDQMTPQKIQNLNKTILHYLNKQKNDGSYQLDLITIEIDRTRKKYRLRHFHNIK